MNENENDFGTLRQFLKLKGFETPPPGYFNNFSGHVLSRIRAGRTTDSGNLSESAWLLKLIQIFEFKPAFAGAFASALFLLLVFGIVYADRTDSTPQLSLQGSDQSAGTFAALSPVTLVQPAEGTGIIATTNPATSLQPIASLFNSQNPLAQQASFSLPVK